MGMIIDTSGRSHTSYRDPPARKRPPKRPLPEPEGPATLSPAAAEAPLASEQYRASIAALDMALRSAETAHGLIVTAEQGMARIGELLARMSVIAAQAAEIGAGGHADVDPRLQDELCRAIAGIRSVVAGTSFGPTRLLDGSLGCHSAAVGEGLEFAGASAQARSSPPEGYVVRIEAVPRQASARGDVALTPAVMRGGLQLSIRQGSRIVHVQASADQAPHALAAALEARAREHSIDVRVELTPEQHLAVRHSRYGREHRYVLESSVPGILSHPDGRPRVVENGRDVRGTIHNEPAEGRGEELTGCLGNAFTEGLSVRYTGPPAPVDVEAPTPSASGQVLRRAVLRAGPAPPAGVDVGRVILVQRALMMRLHAGDHHPLLLRIDALDAPQLGRCVDNGSAFGSVAEIDVASPAAARDALLVITAAQSQVTTMRNALFDLWSGPLHTVLLRLRAQARDLNAQAHGPPGPASYRALVGELRQALRADAPLALTAQGATPPGVLMRLVSPRTAAELGLLWN